MANVTVAQAMNHPTWDMGKRISIDSASMFNKALELIEAKYFFDLKSNQSDYSSRINYTLHGYIY